MKQNFGRTLQNFDRIEQNLKTQTLGHLSGCLIFWFIKIKLVDKFKRLYGGTNPSPLGMPTSREGGVHCLIFKAGPRYEWCGEQWDTCPLQLAGESRLNL